MTTVDMRSGTFHFRFRLERTLAPRTCERFLERLPWTEKVIHSRWSGEAVWVPLGELDLGLGQENHTCYGSRGDVLLYPGGLSETELLLVYGASSFASKMGALAGNHFLTLLEGHEQLRPFGTKVLWEGAQTLTFSLSADSR